jgi:hypothetical protein
MAAAPVSPPENSWEWVTSANYVMAIIAAICGAVVTGLTMAWRGGAAMANMAAQIEALDAKLDTMHAEITRRHDDLRGDFSGMRQDIRDEREAIRSIEVRVREKNA